MKLKLLLTPRYDADPFGEDDSIDKKLGRTHFLPPLGIATLTAFLKKHNFSVDQDDLRIKAFYHNLKTKDPKNQIDLQIFNDEKKVEEFIKSGQNSEFEAEGEKILKLTNCNGFDLFGFSLYETFAPSTAGIALTLGKLLKEKYGAKILIGGSIHYEVAEKMLKTGFVDYLITGESENQLLDLCHNFEQRIPIEKTKGVFFINKDGKITNTPLQEKDSKRNLPQRPCFDGLPLDLYRPKFSFNIENSKHTRRFLILPYIFVNGCPNKCAFCQDAVGKYQAKNPEEVAMDLELLSKRYKTKYFFFINTGINPTYQYAGEFASSIIKNDLDIHWSDCASLLSIDEPLLKKLKEAGAVTLVFGLESASRRILKFIQKPLPQLDHIEKILKTSYKLGIGNELEIICGYPYEKIDDINISINFILKVKEYIQHLHVSKFRPSGLMEKYPEKYKIRLLKLDPSTHRQGHARPFEEIHGLKWGEKAMQIDRFYKKFKESTDPFIFDTPEKIPAMSINGRLYKYFLNSQFHKLIATLVLP